MERRPLLAIPVLVTVLFATAPAAARPDGDGPAVLSAKLRLALPYGGGEALNGSEGVAALLGGSATMELYELVGVELGGTWLRADGERGSYDLYARVGAVPVLWDGRSAAGGGWAVQGGGRWGWQRPGWGRHPRSATARGTQSGSTCATRRPSTCLSAFGPRLRARRRCARGSSADWRGCTRT